MGWLLTKLAMRALVRRKGQAVLIVLGLMISTAVITGSLLVGDSMEYLVYSSTIENLGEVDTVVQAGEFFDYNYYSAIAENDSVANVIDKHAPAIILPCALEASNSKFRENNANLFGITPQFNTIGNYIRNGDEKKLTDTDLALGKNEIIINEPLATKLNVKVNDPVRLFINNPTFSIDTVYSNQQGKNTIEQPMNIKYIVKHESLGRLQLNGRTQDTPNIFMNLTQLQKLLGINNKINSILVSNNGDKNSGVENDDEVAEALGQCLDEMIGHNELGYELTHTGSEYLQLENDDIFFDDDITELISEFEKDHQSSGSDSASTQKVVSSPILSYFVNSMYLEKTNRILNYSIMTGLDFEKDRDLGQFNIKRPALAENIDLDLGEIVLIDWAADQLGATLGDTIVIEYMALDQFNNIYNTSQELSVKYIIELFGKALDRNIMPSFPGLEGKLDCVNWDPSFPVDLDRISIADREFWLHYQGTPKAYITLLQAQMLWGNNLGSLSMIKINTTSLDPINHNSDLENLKVNISSYLDTGLGHSAAGLIIKHVKSDALATSRGMTIFPMMFLTFSSSIILAGIVLIVTIFLILADARTSDFGLLRALGLQKGQVVKLYMLEGLIYALIAGVVGVFVGLFLGWGLVNALNSIWSSAVEGYSVPFFYKPVSLIIGFFTGLILTLITIYITARHIAKYNIITALYNLPKPKRTTGRGAFAFGLILTTIGAISLILAVSQKLSEIAGIEYFLGLFGPVFILLGIGLVLRRSIQNLKNSRRLTTCIGLSTIIYIIIFSLYVFPRPDAPTTELFFIVGILLVTTIIFVTISNLTVIATGLVHLFSGNKNTSPVIGYSLRNPTRYTTRTGLSITIFTFVIFLLAALSINIATQSESLNAISYEERGGYDIVAETAVPLSIDLENATQRHENDLDAPILDNITITEIKLVGPPGGTCSNMNVHYPPRLMGVSSEFVSENAFRFQSTLSDSNKDRQTWQELEKTTGQNQEKIPIVVDYNTLVWIYGGALGDIYEVEDEEGNTVKLEVIGVLENTIFGGTFIMSEENLESLYPNTAEFRFALIKLKPGISPSTSIDQVASELEAELHMYGLDAEPIAELINSNREYERSFMRLFQAFLGFGLIIGMVGLGVITARSVVERRHEIGVLRALGFTRGMVLKSFIIEISFIGLLAILLGQLVGIVSSYLAFGAWTGGSYVFVVPLVDLFILALVIYLVALFSAIYPAYRASKLTPAEALSRIG